MCEYYERKAKDNPKCNYFRRAAEICRGEDKLVNLATNAGIGHGWLTGKQSKSQSEIYNSIRQKLVFYDKQARQTGKVDENGCTCGDTVDFYHDQAFEESGINQRFYGGNFWPQNTRPNPVPYDSRGSETKDDWFNR